MYFKQFYLACLAHASYLIGSDGEAAVVDPQRDVDEYLAEAAAQGLANQVRDRNAPARRFRQRASGDRRAHRRARSSSVKRQASSLSIGPCVTAKRSRSAKLCCDFIETPGHTPEGICVLVTDTEAPDQPQKLLTGDTLFIGDVGRPDLAGGKGYTPQMMAEMMYDSLHGKLLKLPDEVEVYPAHGAGSMCGRNMSKETSSTIGEQRKFNYALKPMSKEEFVTMMTADLPEAPSYFPRDAEINRSGARELSELQPPQP